VVKRGNRERLRARVGTRSAIRLPDSQSLARVLGAGSVIVAREPNVLTSRFGSEVITCQDRAGAIHRLLCKYGPTAAGSGYGHRGGVAYEGAVYRQVLEPEGMDTARLWAVHDECEQGLTWLVIEYFDGAERANWDSAAILPAARWIARFHATMERRVDAPELEFLSRYDEPFLAPWAERADRLVGETARRRFAWWPRLSERFRECVELLLGAPTTVIHGEFYPSNVLRAGDAIRPVDWESAAVGAGEIDLASLVEGWPERLAHECVENYRVIRWPHGAPASFERVLDAARIYLALRWLGDESVPTNKNSERRKQAHYDELDRASRRLGMIA
jgi:Phosphotransferase enzyme family